MDKTRSGLKSQHGWFSLHVKEMLFDIEGKLLPGAGVEIRRDEVGECPIERAYVDFFLGQGIEDVLLRTFSCSETLSLQSQMFC